MLDAILDIFSREAASSVLSLLDKVRDEVFENY